MKIGKSDSQEDILLDGESIKSDLVPPGVMVYYAGSTPPSGWLKANGATLSRSAYARLFDAIGTQYGGTETTFNLPDRRGVFIRGWDDGRGMDPGRSRGSYQGDENKEHQHNTGSYSSGDEATGYGLTLSSIFGNRVIVGDSGAAAFDLTSTSGSEGRPKNYADLVIIKY